MSKIQWHETGKKYYETGVSKGVLYKKNDQGTYSTGVAWNGLTAVNENPSGAEETKLFADDVKYAALRSAEDFGFTIEAYTSPAEFDECDGKASPIAGVTLGQQDRKSFGFSYVSQVKSDLEANNGYKLHLVYDATTGPSQVSRSTINDSPDAITFSWECATSPVEVEGFKPTAHIVIDSTKLDQAGKTALAALEAILYGGENADPTLPTPNVVLSTMGYTPSGTH